MSTESLFGAWIYMKKWEGSKWSKGMEHLKPQAPRPSFDITFSVMKAMQGIFVGTLLELAFCKPISKQLPQGCAFRPRCAYAADVCMKVPETVAIAPDKTVRCWRAGADGTRAWNS